MFVERTYRVAAVPRKMRVESEPGSNVVSHTKLPRIDRRAFLKTAVGLSASALLAPAELSAAEPSSSPPASLAAKKPNFLGGGR